MVFGDLGFFIKKYFTNHKLVRIAMGMEVAGEAVLMKKTNHH